MFPLKTILAGSILLLSSPFTFAIQDNVWTGSTSTDWNNPANWSLGRVPTAVLEDSPVIDLTSPLATISGNVPAFSILQIGLNAPGQLNQIAGTATALETYVGELTTGVFNLADPNGTGSVGTFTGLKTGTGSYDAGPVHVRGGIGLGSASGVLNINTTGTWASQFTAIGESGRGTLNLDAGTLTTGPLAVGLMGGVGFVNQSAGIINVATGWMSIGLDGNGGNPALDASKYRITGGQLNLPAFVEIGADRGGTLDISGTASVSVANGGFVAVGLRNGGKGTLNISGGSLSVADGSSFIVAREPGSTGTVNQTGGSVAGVVSSNWFSIADQPGSSGTYNLQGGSISTNGAAAIGNGGTGTLNVSGGSASFFGIAIGFTGQGTIHQTDGSIVSSNWFDLGISQDSSAPEARYVATGGTLMADQVNVGIGHKARMEVSGTAHTTARTLTVGRDFESEGIVDQSGGTISVSEAIFMGLNPGASALFTHTGGMLDAGALIIGIGATAPRFTTSGDLNIGVVATQLGEVNIRHFLDLAGGTVEAGGDLILLPDGTLRLTPGGNLNVRNGTPGGTAIAGNVNVAGNVATVDGRIERLAGPGAGRTRIGAGATLKGTGVIQGPLDILAGGTLAPGHSPGLLTSGDFSLLAGAHFSLEIGGLAIGTEHDAVMVIGSVTLAGDLIGSVLIGGYSGAPGDTIYVILNDGNDPVSGTFFDGTLPLPEGGTVAIGGIPFTVRYSANADGGAVANDVALVRTVVPEPSALLCLLVGIGFAFKRREHRRDIA